MPKGIKIVEATHSASASTTEGAPEKHPPQPWGYLVLHHAAARGFENFLEVYNANPDNPPQPYFIHKSVRVKSAPSDYAYGGGHDRRRRCSAAAAGTELAPTVSGLVFLQGRTGRIKAFLADYYPHLHLVNDCATRRPASIPDALMRPFMQTVQTAPDTFTFLRDTFARFAKDNVKLRLLTGPFAGYEGYIVRIDRDRQLVFNFGGYAVALRGVHRELFEVAE